mgnify:CR=1 FL=1
MSKLFVVATPIGNLQDITLRAIETLKNVDIVICEDTRETSKLLSHFNIKKELISSNAHNESKKINSLLERIKSVRSAALVSDAGTPCISDPGVRLINAAIKENIEIIPIPGVNAAITALSIAGIPTDSFVFEGFPPQKKGRQKFLTNLQNEKRTIVLYESVYRIEKLLHEINEYLPDRYICVYRELTKLYEESWRGRPIEILQDLPNKILKGEFVIIISPPDWKSNYSSE